MPTQGPFQNEKIGEIFYFVNRNLECHVTFWIQKWGGGSDVLYFVEKFKVKVLGSQIKTNMMKILWKPKDYGSILLQMRLEKQIFFLTRQTICKNHWGSIYPLNFPNFPEV